MLFGLDSCAVTSDLVDLHTCDDGVTFGFWDVDHARVGIHFLAKTQPHLMVYVPLRVKPRKADDFLDACLDHLSSMPGSLWGNMSVDPRDGEVSLRFDLPSASKEHIDAALLQIKGFLDQNYDDLVQVCLAEDDEEVADMKKSLFEMIAAMSNSAGNEEAGGEGQHDEAQHGCGVDGAVFGNDGASNGESCARNDVGSDADDGAGSESVGAGGGAPAKRDEPDLDLDLDLDCLF